MADDSRPLRSGRYYTEAELAAAALAAVHRVVGHGKAYPSRTALVDGLNAPLDAENVQLKAEHDALPPDPDRKAFKPLKPVTASGLSAALALADPSRAAAKYDRGDRIRRLLLRRLPPGFVVTEEPRWGGESDPSDLLPGL